jgi:hypothetical protein
MAEDLQRSGSARFTGGMDIGISCRVRRTFGLDNVGETFGVMLHILMHRIGQIGGSGGSPEPRGRQLDKFAFSI